MDPIMLVLSALATGVAEGAAGGVASDVYNSLRALIQKKFAGRPAAEMVLGEYQKDPQTYSEPLKKSLLEAGVDKDEEILALLQQINSQATATALVTNIGQGAQGNIAQIINNATFTNIS